MSLEQYKKLSGFLQEYLRTCSQSLPEGVQIPEGTAALFMLVLPKNENGIEPVIVASAGGKSRNELTEHCRKTLLRMREVNQ